MLKVIVIDDEEHCIDRVRVLLQNYPTLLSLVGTANAVEEGISLIANSKPDVVFLDVHLHDETGFDLLQRLPSIDFEIVCVTAYDSYAVQAFRFSALDYLLKPVDADSFEKTVERLMQKTGLKDTSKKLEALFHNFAHKVNKEKKVVIPTMEGYTLVAAKEIIRCRSYGGCTDIFCVNDKKITATKTLKHFEELLDDAYFFRVHKSHFINIAFVKKYFKGKGGYVLMEDGTHIEVAVRRKEEFLKRLKG